MINTNDIPAVDNFKIQLNQNIWGLLISFITLGTAEYFLLPKLEIFGCISSILATTSFAITLLVYTINYVKNKLKKK